MKEANEERDEEEDYIRVQEVMTRLVQQEEVLVVVTGRLEEMGDSGSKSIRSNVVLMVKRSGGFVFKLKVLDPTGKTAESTVINTHMKFNVDVIDNKIKWLHQDRLLAVVFHKMVVQDVKSALLKC